MKDRLRQILLVVFVLLLGALILILAKPSGNIHYHLVLSGLSRGRIRAFTARFRPYKGKKMGGYPHLATALKETVASFSGDPYNILSIGSEISGTADTYFTRGEAVISAMNNCKDIEAMLVGNIEFTFGQNRLKELSEIANFPFLSSNVIESGTGQVPDYLSPELIFNPGSGLKVGVVGITPPSTPDVTAKGNVTGLDFIYPGPELKSRIQNLRKAGVNFVVLLTLYNKGKISNKEWRAIADAKPDVCVMVDFSMVAPPPELKDGVVIKTISGYNQTKELDLLNVELSRNPFKILSYSGKRIPIDNDEFEADPTVKASVDDSSRSVEMSKQRVIGSFAEDYQKTYVKECPIGDLIADAMLDAYGGDIAIQNSGGIQSSIKKGKLTLGELFSILPFDNHVVKMNLSGQDILELFTSAASLKRGVLQVSGCSYVYENRGVDDYELKSVRIQNKPLVATMSYSVVTNSFLAEGGDEFIAFKNGRNLRFGRQQRDAVAEYIEKLSASGPIILTTHGRITRDSETERNEK